MVSPYADVVSTNNNLRSNTGCRRVVYQLLRAAVRVERRADVERLEDGGRVDEEGRVGEVTPGANPVSRDIRTARCEP